ncbi:L2 protein [Papillomaviridae sp. Seabass_c24797]|nr:L2 protein [Papillomaviridae sp. Seabass_c24797]
MVQDDPKLGGWVNGHYLTPKEIADHDWQDKLSRIFSGFLFTGGGASIVGAAEDYLGLSGLSTAMEPIAPIGTELEMNDIYPIDPDGATGPAAPAAPPFETNQVEEETTFGYEIGHDDDETVIFNAEEPRTSTPKPAGERPAILKGPRRARGERFEVIEMQLHSEALEEEDIDLNVITNIDYQPITPGEGANAFPDEMFVDSNGVIRRVWRGWREGMSLRRRPLRVSTRIIADITPIPQEMEDTVPLLMDQDLFTEEEAVLRQQRRVFSQRFKASQWANTTVQYTKGLLKYGLSKTRGVFGKIGPFEMNQRDGFVVDLGLPEGFTEGSKQGLQHASTTWKFPSETGLSAPNGFMPGPPPDPPLPPAPGPLPPTPAPLSPTQLFTDTVFEWDVMIAQPVCKKKKCVYFADVEEK